MLFPWPAAFLLRCRGQGVQPPTPLLVMWARHSSGEGGPVAETPELGVPCTCVAGAALSPPCMTRFPFTGTALAKATGAVRCLWTGGGRDGDDLHGPGAPWGAGRRWEGGSALGSACAWPPTGSGSFLGEGGREGGSAGTLATAVHALQVAEVWPRGFPPRAPTPMASCSSWPFLKPPS